MQIPDLTTFFLASAGAGAALVGLLFVAVSVNPGRNAGPNAPPERQAVSASAYTALINAFFISLVSLIGADSLGGVAIVVGSVSLIATVRLVGDLFPPHVSRWIYARHVSFLAIGVIIYGLQVVYGWQYLSHGASAGYAYNIAYLVIAAYGMGLTRAWQLLGPSDVASSSPGSARSATSRNRKRERLRNPTTLIRRVRRRRPRSEKTHTPPDVMVCWRAIGECRGST
jgi:hypothetical protein